MVPNLGERLMTERQEHQLKAVINAGELVTAHADAPKTG